MNEASLKSYYDALNAARAIQDFSRGKTFENYSADDMLTSAIERKFEIIGEALNRIKKKNPEDLDYIGHWPNIISFRNLLAHAYDHVDASVVWGIVTKQIPAFVNELEKIPRLIDEGNDLSDE